MARPAGSVNKPKKAQDLLDIVVAEYKKQGKLLSYELGDIENLSEDMKAEILAEQTANPDLNNSNIFELEGEKEEDYLYQCGECRANLDGEDAICPHCGTTLRWG